MSLGRWRRYDGGGESAVRSVCFERDTDGGSKNPEWVFKTEPADHWKPPLRAKEHAWLGLQDGNVEVKNTMRLLEVEEGRLLMDMQDAGLAEIGEGDVNSYHRQHG